MMAPYFWLPQPCASLVFTVPSKEECDEGAHLAMEDVDSLKEPKMLKVWIKASKTDLF